MISAIKASLNSVPFRSEKSKSNSDKNPISKTGEGFTLLHATAAAGVGVGFRALWFLFENDFAFEDLFKYGKKIVDKNNKGLAQKDKQIRYLGAFAALTIGFVAAIAAIYSLYNTPKIIYQSKANAFVKGKDMDVYIKSNAVQKDLYEQMNDKAKNADTDGKKELNQQYLKLKTIKNPVPDSVKKQ